jgi:hypothetical protein
MELDWSLQTDETRVQRIPTRDIRDTQFRWLHEKFVRLVQYKIEANLFSFWFSVVCKDGGNDVTLLMFYLILSKLLVATDSFPCTFFWSKAEDLWLFQWPALCFG